jgi:hypothetical protein
MNKALGLQLVIYSLLLAGLSYLAHHLVPVLTGATLFVGLVGGGLCLGWGVRAMLGEHGKAPTVLTLVPINFVMFAQAILALGGGSRELAPDRTVAAVTILLLALSIVMLMRVAYAGLSLEGQSPTSTEEGENQSTRDRQTGSPG